VTSSTTLLEQIGEILGLTPINFFFEVVNYLTLLDPNPPIGQVMTQQQMLAVCDQGSSDNDCLLSACDATPASFEAFSDIDYAGAGAR
jgi:hypothetical protein